MDFSKIQLVKDLPISKYEEEIANKLLNFSNLIIIGETGSGKTTQIPLIILKTMSKFQDLKSGKIAITEPRRIAATSVSSYVSSLVGDEIGKTVGYKIRFSEEKSEDTAMVFMTDGILLREAQLDPLLMGYSVIMVDEAHERNINSDFLIGLLVDIQKRRKELGYVPLKILVTSATLEKDKFVNFFKQIPDEPLDIVEVPGRLFPVTTHFEERDIWNYEERAAQLVSDIVWKSRKAKENNPVDGEKQSEIPNITKTNDGDILIFMPGKGEIERTKQAILNLRNIDDLSLEIITIHADLPIEEQSRIFKQSEKRKVIIATNIAETSLTVPGVVYVIDSGLIKSMDFDPHSGINSLITKPHAQKGLEQRKGRAGRIEPGEYFGLYTEKSLKERPEFPMPEILRTSLSQVILIMKILGINDIHTFKFIDHPDDRLIYVALEELRRLGALDNEDQVTGKGYTMASLPLEPILANLIIEANKNRCVETICTIAAFLELKPVMLNQNIEEIFHKLTEARRKFYFEEDKKSNDNRFENINDIVFTEEEIREMYKEAEYVFFDMGRKQRALQYKGSDFLTLLKIFKNWQHSGNRPEWAQENYLSPETLDEATNIRQELLDICKQNQIELFDYNGRDLDSRIEKTFIQAFKFNVLSLMTNGFYRNIRSKEKNIRIHNSSVLREEKPKFALAFEIIEISEIDAPPKLSAKLLHAINDTLMEQSFPDTYRYEMSFEKKRNRDRFNHHNRDRNHVKLKKGHIGRRSIKKR